MKRSLIRLVKVLAWHLGKSYVAGLPNHGMVHSSAASAPSSSMTAVAILFFLAWHSASHTSFTSLEVSVLYRSFPCWYAAIGVAVKSSVSPCFCKKSVPSMAGVTRLSTTRKLCLSIAQSVPWLQCGQPLVVVVLRL